MRLALVIPVALLFGGCTLTPKVSCDVELMGAAQEECGPVYEAPHCFGSGLAEILNGWHKAWFGCEMPKKK